MIKYVGNHDINTNSRYHGKVRRIRCGRPLLETSPKYDSKVIDKVKLSDTFRIEADTKKEKVTPSNANSILKE